MKHSFATRLLSGLLALVMVLGMIPMNTIHVHAEEHEHRDEDSAVTVNSTSRNVSNEDTYLELDYDKPPYKVDSNGKPVYDKNGKLIYLTAEQALAEQAESNRTIQGIYADGSLMDGDYYKSDENQDRWRQVFKGEAKASGGNFRKWLESSDPDDKYIVLMEDMKINVGSGSSWETIKITSDKVLDLNGYTLEFYDQRNGTGDQNTGYYKHASALFEISNDALMTVIDSGGAACVETFTSGEQNYSGSDGETLGTGDESGRIFANGYMINHQKWDFWYYTHRDIFHVISGDLVIYGGDYQAGRQKDQFKSNFSWNKLKTVIGDAVALGTAIYEYATGIEGEFADRADILKKDMYADLREEDNEEKKDDTAKGSKGESVKKDGSGGKEDKKTDTPATKGNPDKDVQEQKKDQTVAQKKTDENKKKDEDKTGDKTKGNKAEEGKDAKPAKKDPENSKIAEANKAIGGAFLDKDKINAMFDTAVKFGEGLYNLFGSNEQTRATACIHGTVARVGDGSTMVIYGGNFTGYGSTPNVRNAVIEVSYNRTANGVQTSSDPRYGRTNGGAVYVYDGTFTAMAGANVFNMYKVNRQEGRYVTVWTVKDVNGESVKTETKVPIYPSETFGLETVTYEKVTYNGVQQEMPVDTGNIMIRGGTFRCYFEPTMMATLNPDTRGTDKNDGQYCPTCDKYDDCDCDDVDHNKFSGTVGSVNLGVQSFDEDMIRDGRIQLVDVYGSGKLVLLDGGDLIEENPDADSDKTEEEILADEQESWEQAQKEAAAQGKELSSNAPDNTYTNDITEEGGIRQYRLYISDVELRALEYLTVHPNTAITNSTESFALQTYYGTPDNTRTTQSWATDPENIRAPYSSTEGYFEYEFDKPGYSEGIFISPDLKLDKALIAGEELAKSPVWYYNIPVNANGESLGNFVYTDTYVRSTYPDGYQLLGSYNRLKEDKPGIHADDWWPSIEWIESDAHSGQRTTRYYKESTKYLTNTKFFVYKIYRVDPLSRENINESDVWSADEPLLELRYGADNDSVKCIVTLKELEKAIEKRLKEKGEIGRNESWSYRSGDLYRIVFSVEEHLGYGYTGTQEDGEVKFTHKLPKAETEASILIRCVSASEDKDDYHYNPTYGTITSGQVADWTPLQFVQKNNYGRYEKTDTVVAGGYGTVELINGQTGMVDWQGARIFDIYYQWYIMDDAEDTTPTLIAGTDNVWIAKNPYGSKQFHSPDNFLLTDDGTMGVNGEHYANTVDPESPEATMYTYGANGLPVKEDDVRHSPDLWTAEMLHMYTYETCNYNPGMQKWDAEDIANGLAPAGTRDKLYLGNNNTFWGNTDSVYIPAEYVGKYLMCKMVAVNVRYPHLYDNLQTVYSHVVKIDGPELPKFETVTPAVTDKQLEVGTTNLGILTEPPTFAFTYTDIANKYINAGYKVQPKIEIVQEGGNSGIVASNQEECAEGWTPYHVGTYQVTMSLELKTPTDEVLSSRSMTYSFTLSPVKATFTSMKPWNPTAAEKTAGVIDLGTLDTPPELGFTYDYEMPDWMKDQGYYVRGYIHAYTNGKLDGSLDDNPDDNVISNLTSWTPSGFGDRTIVYEIVVCNQLMEVVSSTSFTIKFTLPAQGVDFVTMSPMPTDAEREAGLTELGTIQSMPYFGFSYDNSLLPQWMRDAGYVLDGTMTIKRDGEVVLTNWGQSTQPAKRAGDYEVNMELRLLDSKKNVIDQVQHRYTFTVPMAEAQYIAVNNLQDRYIKGTTFTFDYHVGPKDTADQTVTWHSSDESVATVDANGTMTCVNCGEATITVVTADETIEKSFNVLVTNEGVVYVGGVGLNVGEYLASGSKTPTTTKPAEGGYAYLIHKSILELHDFTYCGKYDAIVGPDAATVTIFNVKLYGDNHLDMTPSREESYSYEYYNANGITAAKQLQIGAGSQTNSLRLTGFNTGLDAEAAMEIGERVQLFFDKSGTATDISASQIVFNNAIVEGENGLYVSGTLVFNGGTYRIITDSVAAYANSMQVGNGADVRIVSTESSAIALSGSNCRLTMSGGNLYAEGKTCAVGTSQKGFVIYNPADGAPAPNVLLISSAEGEPSKGARDSINSAINFATDYTAVLTYGSPYQYASTERYGENGEVFDEAKRNEYDFVFIGTDPTVFGTTVYVDPDCTEEWDGTTDLTGYENVSILLGHTLEYHEEIPAGCVTTGVCEYWYCTDCRKMYADEACTTQITDTTLEALDHDWMHNTCTEPRHCLRCGLTDERYPETGHSWYPATCTDPMMCRWCDATMGTPIDHIWVEADCNYGEHCDMCWTEISDPLGHVLEGELIFPEWAKINCSWGIEVQQWCSRCEEYIWVDVEPDPSAHNWIGGDCETPAQCEYCQMYALQPAGHQWEAATCETPETCSVCGATNGSAHGHAWEAATCANPKYCINCGATEGGTLAHTWKNATCEDPKTCTACWATEGEKLNHTWDTTDCTKTGTCAVCGETREAAAHILTITSTTDLQHTGTCDECGMTITEEHTFGEGDICGICGQEGPAMPAPEYSITYTQASISLAGDIGLNYYATLSEDLMADEEAYMIFTVAGEEQIVPISEAIISTGKNGELVYRFSCAVPARMMSEQVVGQMYASDGTAVGEGKAFSVKAYCDKAIAAYGSYASYANLVNLMKAMLNYGGYSQIKFGYNTGNLANADLEDKSLPNITAADLAAFAHGKEGTEAGINIQSVSLLLESTTTIRFYFKLDGSKPIESYTFVVDGEVVEPVHYSGTTYYVDKVGVPARELDVNSYVEVGGLRVWYCGMSYVRQILNSSTDTALINACKALYAYSEAANSYFK